MKYKVGDKVRIKSNQWYITNKDNLGRVKTKSNSFNDNMSVYCGMVATITNIGTGFKKIDYSIDIDNGYWCWPIEAFEDSLSYNTEKSILSEEMIKDIAEVIKTPNLGICISENGGKLIIEPLEEKKEEDLPIDTPVMVKCGMWSLGYYAGNKRVFVCGKSNECKNQTACGFEIIIPFDKFNPNDIEESLKYNIVK